MTNDRLWKQRPVRLDFEEATVGAPSAGGTHLQATLKAAETLSSALDVRIFTKGEDDNSRRHEDLRRFRFKSFAFAEMHVVIGEHGLPVLGALTVDETPESGPSASSMRVVNEP